ncbi:hypothetical protein FHW69_003791 [Luteibacter sp. Sphag1AF]|uniref:hypothetical protein n=1 Tax=Luteibacter sp. Sphag1AF TaxID=2587031 RepID=UPI0016140BD7|nr:hypothetical protein [Luteibacter sp. Sphag1AF]MBB3229139.1 hypothetical protein [Luteibacter sp. Sphag1AF]
MCNETKEQVRKTAETQLSNDDIFFGLISGLSGLHAGGSVISLTKSYLATCGVSGLKLNPYFVKDGNTGASPKTAKMLVNRRTKGFGVGFTGVAAAGINAATAPVPAPFSLARHASATASTLRHLYELSRMLAAYQSHANDEDVANAIRWLQLAIEVKLKKLAVRGTDTALSATSVVLMFTGVGLAGKVPIIMINFQMELYRLRIKDKYTALCKIAAMELHWAAFREQDTGDFIKKLEQRKSTLFAGGPSIRQNVVDAKTGARLGPATLIIKEIMSRHTLQAKFFSAHDYLEMIREPAGWNAIADKLLDM